MAREMSTIEFPYGDLDEGTNVVRLILDNGGTRCAIDQLAAWLGHDTTNSGAFRSKVSTARIFGLVDTEREAVALTPLGHEILDPTRAPAARARAFLNVPLYGALYERFRGRLLPPDKGLEAVIDELGVSSKQTARARQAFQRSARQAGFFEHGTNRLVPPGSHGGSGELAIVEDSEGESLQDRGTARTAHPTRAVGSQGENSEHPLLIGLFESLPAPGDEWSPEDRAKWLSAAENIFALIYAE